MYKFVLYISDSISALQICSSVLFLCIPHVNDIIWYLFFSFWLTSLCMTISRSIHQKYRSMRKDSPKINPGMWDLSFLTRYPTCASCSESTESKLLNCLGDLPNNILDSTLVFELCLHLILKKSKQYSPCMGAAYLRGWPDLAAPMLSFQSCFFWHQRGKCKLKKKKKNGSSDFQEDYQAFIENEANSQKFWSSWALWRMEVIQMFVLFLSWHCTFILNEFWVLFLNILSISVKRKIPIYPTDVFPYEPS